MKAVLVIDMPNQCIECPCYRQVRDGSFLLEYCNANEKRLTWQEVVEVPEWCPLKPMPQKMEEGTIEAMMDEYSIGWNDCLEEIEK